MPMADKMTEEETRRLNAAICLMCTKSECTGSEACFREQKKRRQRQYQAERRLAERAMNAFYDAMWEQERRERLEAAHKAFHEQQGNNEP